MTTEEDLNKRIVDAVEDRRKEELHRRLDLFAAAALQGMLASPEYYESANKTITELAWIYAKNMIDQGPG